VQTFKSKAAITAAGSIAPDLVKTDAATPCGLIAKSLFNDTYQIKYALLKEDLSNPAKVTILNSRSGISHANIAWESDVKYKFKNTPSPWDTKQWWDMTDEHFIVWMRTAGLPNFRKLWGNMTNVKKGFYQIEINN